ncbi:MAG: hypothetical protein J6S93_11820 [Paludibacteraceae bacterium]|nr:hypothetical protein [Paludibacteraceae bacterium]
MITKVLSYTILAIFSTFVLPIYGQDAPIYEWQTNSLSPSESRWTEVASSIDSRITSSLRLHPVYHAMMNAGNDSSLLKQNIVLTSFGKGKTNGDFLPYEGKANKDWRLFGHGCHNFGKHGTLYGTIQYARGTHKEISWSAMRFPELYWPYTLTDSTGGDSHFEYYGIEGGYGVKLRKVYFGVIAQFDGELAHRMTDPRLKNNTTFLQLGFDAGYISPKGHRLMAEAKYLRNKEHESDSYWRPGEQQRFFTLYGFGLYDNKRSTVSGGRSRMYYINGFKSHLSYASPTEKKLCTTINLGWNINKMDAEESDFTSPYGSRTTTLTPQIEFKWKINENNVVSLLSDNNLEKRLGYERVFEKYVTNTATSTYDYRQIAENQYYSLSSRHGLNAVRYAFSFGKHNTLGFQYGVGFFCIKEKNSFYDFSVVNKNIVLLPRIDYKLSAKKHELSACFNWGRQKVRLHEYDVDIKTSSIQHLDFQTCFAPYAYYASEYDLIAADLTYVYNFNKFGLGLRLKYMNISGNRLDDVEYTKEIGFNSICPMISPQSDIHDEHWLNGTLFVLF